MNRFVVVLPPDSNVTAQSVSAFSTESSPCSATCVGCGRPAEDLADVCEALGIGEGEEAEGLVVLVHTTTGSLMLRSGNAWTPGRKSKDGGPFRKRPRRKGGGGNDGGDGDVESRP